MNRKALLKRFKQCTEKSSGRKADLMVSAVVQMAIENGCECAVFVRDNAENYSARGVAMSVEKIAYQFAKTILAIHRKEGYDVESIMQVIEKYLKEETQ